MSMTLFEQFFPHFISIGQTINWQDSGLDRSVRGLRLPLDADGQLIAIPVVQFKTQGEKIAASFGDKIATSQTTNIAGTIDLVIPAADEIVRCYKASLTTTLASVGAFNDIWQLLNGLTIMYQAAVYIAAAVGGTGA